MSNYIYKIVIYIYSRFCYKINVKKQLMSYKE
jgi:hypothetical protein